MLKIIMPSFFGPKMSQSGPPNTAILSLRVRRKNTGLGFFFIGCLKGFRVSGLGLLRFSFWA